MTKKIRKIKLSNGQIYSIFDAGGIHYDERLHKLVSGNPIVDTVLDTESIRISEIDDIKLTSDFVVYNPETGELNYRSKDKVLKDIGGTAYQLDESDGTLKLQIGKFKEN